MKRSTFVPCSTIVLGLLGLAPLGVHALPMNPVLLGDQTRDQILLLRDKNGDGDANDAGEMHVFFDENNNAGIAAPTGNVLAINQGTDGSVYFGDGDTDTVYRLRDNNRNGNAQDAGEANVWFSAANAGGLPLLTPNGVDQGGDGAIYIVEADVVSTPNGDFVYRTQDMNNDGDANDVGEATAWLDLKALNPSSSPFEIDFDGDVAYIADTAGSATNVVYRAEDVDGSGAVDGGEITTFISDGDFGLPVDFAIAAFGGDLFLWEFLDFTGDQSVFKLTDVNGSGMIDDLAEVVEVWNTSVMPAGFGTFAAFDVAVGPDGELVLTSNGSAAEDDNLVRLLDLNGDGDYLDPGETFLFASNAINGSYPVRPRTVAYYEGSVPISGTLLLLMPGVLMLVARRARQC